MSNAWFLRLLGAMLLLLGLLSSAITYHPDAQWLAVVLPIFFWTGAVMAFGVARVFDRLPQTHWVHNSRPHTAGLVVLAVALALLLAFG